MVSTATLKFLLLAENHASKAMKDVGGDVDKTGKKIGGMSTGAKVALAGLGVAAVGFANSSIHKFQQVTSESRGLQRALGGTLEEASRMREAAILSGVDYDTFKKSINKLDKTLVGATANQKTAAAMTKTLGISFQDASGHVKPMGELLPQISDQFKKMPDGPEKTALAMKLFGKAGTDMLPFLGKGSAGIKELEKQSDKFGTTLKSGSIDALAKSREQTRLWQAGMDGLKVQIGAQLLPIMNKLIGFIQQYVIPVIQKITAFVKDHKQAVMLAVVVIGTLIIGMKAWAIAQGILNTVMALNPIALVVIAIAALAAGIIYAYKHSETFRHIIQVTWAVIKTAIMAVWDGYLHPMFIAWRAIILGIGNAALWLWRNAVQPAWNGIRAVISGAWNVIKPVAAAIGAAWHGISDALGAAWVVITRIFGWIKSGIHGVAAVVRAVSRGIKSAIAPFVAAFEWMRQVVMGILDRISSAIQSVIDAYHALTSLGGGPESPGQKKINKKVGSGQSGGLGHSGTPYRAAGGRALAGMSYIVGEERPELFTPDRNGTISPRLGGGGDITINVDIHGITDKYGAALEVRQMLLGLKRTLRADLGLK